MSDFSFSSIFSSVQIFLRRIYVWAMAHKMGSGVIIVLLLGGAWFVHGQMNSASGTPQYLLSTVATGTIVASLSESGQVSTTNSVDIKPKVSGDITWIGVKAGMRVSAGQALLTLDNTDAVQSYNSAKKTLAADELQYQKDQAQAPISYQNDLTALSNAKETLQNDYTDTFNDLTTTYLDLPDAISTAQNTLYGYDFDALKSQWNMDLLLNAFSHTTSSDTSAAAVFQLKAKTDYATARADYTATVSLYQTTSRSSGNDATDALLTQSISMMNGLAQALQSELNFYNSVSDLSATYDIDLPSNFTTVQSKARSELSTVNGDLSSLLSAKKTLDNAKQSVTTAEQTLQLDKVGNVDGANPISLQITLNNLEKERQSLADQATALGDYTVRAPFSGIISSLSTQVGDAAGSAAVGTIISDTQIAQLSVNEVDAAKIKLGQKATLTFDAIDGLSLTGTVSEIDAAGAVSQGVVSYTVKIAFDTQNSQVKSGMTVEAAIQTDIAQDTLTVPSSAVKTQGGNSYVLVFNPPLPSTGIGAITTEQTPQMIPVTTGISDATNIQILSGLSAGEQVVARTITGTNPSASPQTGTAARATAGARGGFGGAGGGTAVFRAL